MSSLLAAFDISRAMGEDGHVIELSREYETGLFRYVFPCAYDQSSSMFAATLIKLSGPLSFYIQAAKFSRATAGRFFGSFRLELSRQFPVGIVFYASFFERVSKLCYSNRRKQTYR